MPWDDRFEIVTAILKSSGILECVWRLWVVPDVHNDLMSSKRRELPIQRHSLTRHKALIFKFKRNLFYIVM